MTNPAAFAQAALPLHLSGDTGRAILLIHGFTSTPGSLAGWAEGLHRSTGDTVAVPLLPGHGTRWEDVNRVTWQDWEAAVLGAFDALAATHRTVSVGGLSLGGALAVLVAARRPRAAALVLVNHLMWLGNPALFLAPVIKRLTPSMPAVAGDIKKPGVWEPAYDRVPTGGVDQFRRLLKAVRPLLPGLTLPTLLFKSREDHVIPAASTLKTIQRLGSVRKDLVWLDHSYHVATMDHDLHLIVEQSARFLGELS
jgi:carboxylesterase